MQAEIDYFAYCLDTSTRKNYFIVPSKFLKPRPKAINSKPGITSETLGPGFCGAVIKSAWHESFEVDSDDGSYRDEKLKTNADFEHLLSETEYKECLVLATASSVQELQLLIKMKDIEESRKRRYDFSDASGGQQHDEPQQQKKKIRSSQSNQQTSNKDYPTASKGSEKSYSATASLANEKPEEEKSLGYFEIADKDRSVTKQKADNVCVLVINYLLKDCPKCKQNGVGSCDGNKRKTSKNRKNKKCKHPEEDKTDVDNLETHFATNRKCKFLKLSPDKKTLLHLLGDDKELLQYFNTKDDVPSVFVLFILAHGGENGEIGTDKDEIFTTDGVFNSLQRLQRFDKCLKIVIFGPCRGKLNDSKSDIEKSHEDYENRNSCRITTRPGIHNCVVFYSTVEKTYAFGDKNGSWFVQSICTCLNYLENDVPLLKFFTIVQNQMHEMLRNFWTDTKKTIYGQTPELKMFTQDRKFIFSKSYITGKPIANSDKIGDKIKVNPYFSWKSDEGQDIRGRRGFILSVPHNQQVQKLKKNLCNLDYEVTNLTLSKESMKYYFEKVSELEPDVGCIMTFIFGPVFEKVKNEDSKKEENEESNKEEEMSEVCVRVEKGEEIPITDILHSLVGPENDKLIGKPKILFVVNVEAPETYHISVDVKDLQVSATNHSGWLVLISKCEDALEKLIELFGKIDEKISLQELVEDLLTRESIREEDVVLLNSTLQYLINFPNCPRAFVEPDFKLKKTQIPPDEMDSSKISTKSNEEHLDFGQLMGETKQFMVENKKSIANRRENPQTSSDFESNPVIDSARPCDASIVWLFNSVAGAGKSTVLKEMRHQLNKIDLGFEILLIHLNEKYQNKRVMNTNEGNEIEFLAKATCNTHDDINNWIKKKELIVFLDGFDGVCPDFKDKIINILIALSNARVPLFVGTRPHEVHHIQDRIKNSTIVEIEPLDEAKQIEFLRIVERKNQQEIERLMKIYKDQDILGNPLYLSLLAKYSGDGNLYKIFDKIVRHKVEICLKRENGGKDVGEETIKKELKFIQLVASRFVRGAEIEQGSVTKDALEKMNASGVVTYYNGRVNFSHQTFAEFLTAQKFIDDLKIKGTEKEPLFNDEFVQCRKFVDLFFSTEKGKDASYVNPFVNWAKWTNPLQLVKQICGENLKQMFNLLNPDLSLKDKDDKNALHFALRHLEMVKMVHEKDSKLMDETTKNGESCIHLAIADEKCSEKVALWLLENTDVDKNAETKSGETPLLLACEKQKWKVAELLVFANVEVNKRGRKGKSILQHAVLSNEFELVQELLDKGSDVKLKDDSGATALHIAARWNEKADIVDILLQKGADVHAKDNEQRTALHYAAENNQEAEIIRTLLGNSADVHSKDEDGRTALHLAAWSNENPEILQILIDNGAGVNAKDNYDWTALHFAARYSKNPEVVQKLLDEGLSTDNEINAENDDGQTALFLALKYNPMKKVVEKLLDHGAKENEKIMNDKKCAEIFRQMKINREVR